MNMRYLFWCMLTFGQTYAYIIKDGRGDYMMSSVSWSQARTRNMKPATWWFDNPKAKIATISIKEVEEIATCA